MNAPLATPSSAMFHVSDRSSILTHEESNPTQFPTDEGLLAMRELIRARARMIVELDVRAYPTQDPAASEGTFDMAVEILMLRNGLIGPDEAIHSIELDIDAKIDPHRDCPTEFPRLTVVSETGAIWMFWSNWEHQWYARPVGAITARNENGEPATFSAYEPRPGQFVLFCAGGLLIDGIERLHASSVTEIVEAMLNQVKALENGQ